MATEQPEAFESGLETDLDAGWFFVLQERPGDVRFGADVPESDTGLDQTSSGNTIFIGKRDNGWIDLNWGNLADAMGIDKLEDINHIEIDPNNLENSLKSNLTSDPPWGNNSANMAYILYQPHNRVAIHADQMIK
jgi:hypothetical protein